MDRRISATPTRMMAKPVVQNIFLKDEYTGAAGSNALLGVGRDEKMISAPYSVNKPSATGMTASTEKEKTPAAVTTQEKADMLLAAYTPGGVRKGVGKTAQLSLVTTGNARRLTVPSTIAPPTSGFSPKSGSSTPANKLDIESSKGWSNLINFNTTPPSSQPVTQQSANMDDAAKLSLLRRLSDMGPEPAVGALAKRKTLLLPQRRGDEGKLTVVLDMDETLIHSEFMGPVDYRQAEERLHVSGKRPPDFTIKLYENSPDQEEEIVHVYKRPGLDNFLRKLSEIVEPVIFTAALPMYARPILKQIDPKRRCKSRLYRNATVKFAGYPHVKSLKNLGRNLARVILVDNSPYAMAADPDNAVPIKSYYDDTEDRELEYLYEIIKEMVDVDDVRPHLKRKFNFGETIRALLPNI